MKFKAIFFLFNITLIFSFSFIFLMPLFLLDGEYLGAVWAQNWPLGAFFLVVLAAFNAFFLSNWKLFALVESEDWAALAAWLDDRIFKKGRYNRRYVRLFINASLLRSDLAAVRRLEDELSANKPAAVRRDAVAFAAARLLGQDHEGAERFIASLEGHAGGDNASWLSFYHAFSLVLLKRTQDAAPALETLLGAKDRVLSLLSAYLLGSLCAAGASGSERERLSGLAQARKAALAARYTPAAWARETERAKGEVHIVLLSRLIDDAGTWLFDGSGPAGKRQDP